MAPSAVNTTSLSPAAGFSLQIIIVGAGIAGLAAATGLRRAGHRVTIFEQSKFTNETGAAIYVPPNATRVLLPWGFDLKRARPYYNHTQLVARADNLETITLQDLSKIESIYSAPWLLCHRVDLHSELKRLATRDEGPGEPVQIRLNAKVVDIDPVRGTVVLRDSSSHTADLIVAADGVHSMAVSLVTGRDTPAIPTGLSAFRFLIPTELIQADDRTREFLIGNYQGAKIFTKDHRRIVWYPCRAGEVQNFAGIFPDNENLAAKEDWNVRAKRSDILDVFHDFHPNILAACEKAEDVRLWKLLYREPIPTWHSHRLLLIGDAAHPMLPHQGQGGAQSIEDGAALGILFSHLPFPAPDTPEQIASVIETRLVAFEEIRRGRASLMQIYSSAGQDQAQEQVEKRTVLAKAFLNGGKVPTRPDEFVEFGFRHDVVAECEKVLEGLV